MASQKIDNRAPLLGGNDLIKATLSAAAGVERTLPAMTLLVLKAGETTKFVPLAEAETLPIEGLLLNDVDIAASGGAADYTDERVVNGYADAKLIVAANSLTTIDDLPSGGVGPVRLQLENKGIVAIDREQMNF